MNSQVDMWLTDEVYLWTTHACIPWLTHDVHLYPTGDRQHSPGDAIQRSPREYSLFSPVADGCWQTCIWTTPSFETSCCVVQGHNPPSPPAPTPLQRGTSVCRSLRFLFVFCVCLMLLCNSGFENTFPSSNLAALLASRGCCLGFCPGVTKQRGFFGVNPWWPWLTCLQSGVFFFTSLCYVFFPIGFFFFSFCLWVYCCCVNQPGKWCWVMVLAAASLAACLGKPQVCFEKQAKWKKGGTSRPPFYCFTSVWNGRDQQPGTRKTQERHICPKSRGNVFLRSRSGAKKAPLWWTQARSVSQIYCPSEGL